MNNKCPICGMVVRHSLIKCEKCGKKVCLHCFSNGRCSDCIVEEYNFKYEEKINEYAKII